MVANESGQIKINDIKSFESILQSEFRIKSGELEMYDAIALNEPQSASIAVAKNQLNQYVKTISIEGNATNLTLKGTYGVCKFVPSRNASDFDKKIDNAYSALSVIYSAHDIGMFVDPRSPEIDTTSTDISFTVFESPRHGKLTEFNDVHGLKDFKYEPDENFIGTEKIVLLVKGKEGRTDLDRPKGTPIEFKLVYYIKVTKEKYRDYLQLEKNGARIDNKYCPRIFWPISLSKVIINDLYKQTDFTNWKTTAKLNAMLANASGSLTNFSDLTACPRVAT
ncbi:hypothetical protein [Undibacterium curvum]|uniref:Uncharacterized protein n=1 Tax=Undibacterium curvum TaxID=2762294 RepID=A0ABR7A1U2_9BURK|nr:hypothetical protein [Undibacterium curvum]MBC3930885.1 hypothetical protein [Undibacterium curvum]